VGGFALRLLFGFAGSPTSNCVGDSLGPRLPFWLAVVIERDEVAVVVPCVEPSNCHVISPALKRKMHTRIKDSPSASEPAMEPGPLIARVLAGYMADPIE
jgi:hypothetical protein